MSSSKEKCADRLTELIHWSGMSANAFSRHIGLKNAENLYQILRGNNGISRRLADTIAATLPQVNVGWLMSGRGVMINEESSGLYQVQFYDVDVESNVINLDNLATKSSITIPIAEKADFAMLYRGSAMGSVTPTNSVVVFKRVDVESIVAGKEYLVVSGKVATLRFVRTPIISDPEVKQWRLVAVDSDTYDDILVDVSDISVVYRVVAKVIVNY
ncbi:MAG: hypothetical protein SNF68_07940 [Rikenellaceae bacterium]